MNALFRMILLAALICGPCPVPAQTEAATVIPANLAASHVGEYITVEGVVAKVFTSKSGNTFLNIGAAYPNQTFTGWIPPASPVSKSLILPGIEGKHVKITGRIENKEAKDRVGPILWRIPARVVGVGFRPEHVKDR
jgi:hypothetical protein